MSLFEAIVRRESDPSDDERIAFVKDWIKDEYDIEGASDRVLLEIATLYTNENNVFFGTPVVTTSSTFGSFRLVQANGTWALAYRKAGETAFILLFPKSTDHWEQEENKQNVDEARRLLEAGELYIKPEKKTMAIIDGNNVELNIHDDFDDTPAIDQNYSSNGILETDLSNNSITIDLDKQ